MDNLAHTLVGAALGRAVADRKVPAAGWIGAIAGNAPDWSELLVSPGTWGGAPGSAPAYLVYHRGITHSFVGAVIEIVVLTGLVGFILTWRTRADAGARPPWRWIAVCVAAAVASHLYLDWQGSYGLRPFLPWSGRWYYGDWVAIVDPFFWAVPLVALAWGSRRHWAPALLVLLVMSGVTTLVLWTGRSIVAAWVRLGVTALMAACVVGWAKHWFRVAGRRAGARHSARPRARAVRALPCGRRRLERQRAQGVSAGRALRPDGSPRELGRGRSQITVRGVASEKLSPEPRRSPPWRRTTGPRRSRPRRSGPRRRSVATPSRSTRRSLTRRSSQRRRSPCTRRSMRWRCSGYWAMQQSARPRARLPGSRLPLDCAAP